MKLRIPDAELEIGDVAVHGEEAYPTEELALVGAGAPGEPPDPAAQDGKVVPDKVSQTEP